jgi:hypothetical protein
MTTTSMATTSLPGQEKAGLLFFNRVGALC